jgi:hypothetical protein
MSSAVSVPPTWFVVWAREPFPEAGSPTEHVGQEIAGVVPPLETIGATPVTDVTPPPPPHVGQEITGVVPPVEERGAVAVTLVTQVAQPATPFVSVIGDVAEITGKTEPPGFSKKKRVFTEVVPAYSKVPVPGVAPPL